MFYHTGWRFRFLQLQAFIIIVQFVQIEVKNKPKSVQVDVYKRQAGTFKFPVRAAGK